MTEDQQAIMNLLAKAKIDFSIHHNFSGWKTVIKIGGDRMFVFDAEKLVDIRSISRDQSFSDLETP